MSAPPPATREDRPSALRLLRFAAARIGLLLGVWLLISEANPGGLIFGVWVVGLAAAASFALSAPHAQRWTLLGLLRFAAFFFSNSLHGGADVAARALRPGLPISPTFLRLRSRLPEGLPRTLFKVAVTLMPGTLCADTEGDVVVVHSLTGGGPRVERALRRLEDRLAQLFLLSLADEGA